MNRHARIGRLCLLVLAAGSAHAAIPEAPAADAGTFVEFPLEHVAALDHPPLNELSGLVTSSDAHGVYWAHNDSGAKPRLFAIDGRYEIHVPEWQRHRYTAGDALLRAPWPGVEITNASLVDWEDIARVGDRLYIGDVGNNGNARRDLGFYELREPVPSGPETIRATRFIPVHYPEQASFPGSIWEWDCEAVFADGERLYLLTKHREPESVASQMPGARLYALDLTTASTTASNPLRFISRHDTVELATAADLSPDGEVLAVLTYAAVWFFSRPAPGSEDWLGGMPAIRTLPIFETRQAEALAWRDDGVLVITNEGGSIFEMQVDRTALQAAFSEPEADSRPR